jgi:hypothetical protein
VSDLPITEDMPSRFGGLVPRIIVIVLVFVLATATLTFAASRQATHAASVTTPPKKRAVLTVPSVTGQVYVFAKGVLEDAGFAWRVGAGAKGYAGYRVVAQTPIAGTRVFDTGSPTIVLRLERDAHYATAGHAADSGSPYPGTAVELVGSVSRVVPATPAPVAKPAAKPKAAPKKKVAAPKKKAVAAKPAAKKPVVAKKAAAPVRRTPDFVVAGAAKEPLDEMPLTQRAELLRTWVASHPEASSANVQHWLYQHSWIVAGAKFGWWHGAEALQTLIAVDRQVERQWSMGAKSEADAQAALDYVRSHSR